MDPINKQRAHENAALLTRQSFSNSEGSNYKSLLKVCTAIENNLNELLNESSREYFYQGYDIFVSPKRKIFLLTEGKDFELGNGSFKTIYVGMDYFKGKLIAHCNINLSYEHLENQDFFENEAKLLSLANRDKIASGEPCWGIIKMLESYSTSKKIVMVFKYYKLGTLHRVMQQKAPSFNQKIQIAYDVVSGLAHLHRLNIIHNDIKESNILLDLKLIDQHKKLQAVLCDLGLSRKKHPEDQDHDTYKIRGNRFYYSPERMRAIITDRPSTRLTIEEAKQADMWALGCVLYNLFFGPPPWFKLLRHLGKKWICQHPEEAAETLKTYVDVHLPTAGMGKLRTQKVYNIIRGMLCTHGEDRTTANEALSQVTELLPAPLIPPLKPPLGYPSDDSNETPDSEDVSRESSKDM